MPLKVTQTMIDHSGEPTRTSFWTGGEVADDYTVNLTDANDVQTGIAALTLCNFVNLTGQIPIESDVPVLPGSENAQREQALLITYADAVNGKKYHMSIPGIDRNLVAQAGTDVVDIVSNVAMAAFVVIMEANMVSELGNAIEVVAARLVGRSN